MADKKKFCVKIRWGTTGTQNEKYKNADDGEIYEFDTEAERKAFLQGVDESNGWMDYTAWSEEDDREERNDGRNTGQ